MAVGAAKKELGFGGSHPGMLILVVPLTEGAVLSCVQVTVEEAVAVLPQASVAVNDLVWVLVQPFD